MQHVDDQMRFCRKPLRSVFVQIFMRLEKAQKMETTNKNSMKICEKTAFEALKAYSAPQNMFN